MGLLRATPETLLTLVYAHGSQGPKIRQRLAMPANKLESSVTRIQCRFRPALAEARLMTAKQAGEQTHFLVLAEEVRSIEQSIASLEHSLRISRQQSCLEQEAYPADWQWMREKSAELDRRLRQIESKPSSDRQSRSMSTTGSADSRRTVQCPEDRETRAPSQPCV